MIKKMAWNTFKNTGDINTFLELKEIQNIESQIGSGGEQIHQSETQIVGETIQQIQHQMEEQNGNDKNEWNNNF